MKGFKVLLKNWRIHEDDRKEDVLIEDDHDALVEVGGYLLIGMNGELFIAEGYEGSMGISTFTGEYEIIWNKK